MKVYHSLEHLPEWIKPVFLTIGNFDGVHLGHQGILNHLIKGARGEQLESFVITFSNHPSQILRPNHPIPLITSKDQKLILLENLEIDHVLILEFTLPFSDQSAEEFLKKIYNRTPIRRLILGSNAKFGNDRQGNTPLLHALAQRMHFSLEFLPIESFEQEPITSSRIRAALQNAELEKALKMLGRKYSIVEKVIHGTRKGHALGYPTLNLPLTGLCHPPFGVYPVTVIHKDLKYNGIANLGIAPTVRKDHIPLLEVHLINESINLYNETVEVVFEDFFRSERIFENEDELKRQIAADIDQAKEFFNIVI